MITFQAFFKNQGDASKIEVLRMLNWRPKQIFVLRTFLAKTLECNIYECYSILYCSFYGAATNYYHTIFILNSFTLIFFALFLSQCTLLVLLISFSTKTCTIQQLGFMHFMNTLNVLFPSNHNIHKSSYGLCFWVSDPLIARFQYNLSIKGSEAQKQRPYELL